MGGQDERFVPEDELPEALSGEDVERGSRHDIETLESRITRCEKLLEQLQDQLREMDSRKLQSEGPPRQHRIQPVDPVHTVIYGIEEVQENTEEDGVSREAIKDYAQQNDHLRSHARAIMDRLIDRGYATEPADGRIRLEERPPDDSEMFTAPEDRED